jgi:hypothetical protein
MLVIHNSLGRAKQEFVPPRKANEQLEEAQNLETNE